MSTTRVLVELAEKGSSMRRISHGMPTETRRAAVWVRGLSQARVTAGARREEDRMDWPSVVRAAAVEYIPPKELVPPVARFPQLVDGSMGIMTLSSDAGASREVRVRMSG